MAETRPGNGTCVRCHKALGMASLKVEGVWYCGPECVEGRPVALLHPAVPEHWLYGVPRRFFRRRAPKELHSAQATRPAQSDSSTSK